MCNFTPHRNCKGSILGGENSIVDMVKRRRDIRLSSKELFIFHHYKLGSENEGVVVGGCTNKRILSEKTGIDYNTLMWVFTRKGRCYYDNGETVILKLFTNDIEKGRQSLARRGRGGMDSFVRYVSGGSRY